jgi:hypothetical protein
VKWVYLQNCTYCTNAVPVSLCIELYEQSEGFRSLASYPHYCQTVVFPFCEHKTRLFTYSYSASLASLAHLG